MSGHQSADAEAKFIAASVKGWLTEGVAPSEIGIAVRAKWLTSKIEQALRAAGIDSVDLAKASDDDDAIRVGTMHHQQDLERERCVLFVACTRAREERLVTWHGEPSPFLTALQKN